ncbi:MAG TPA: hypothetical protein PLE19_01670 [Planctomycetota bacterium]|nr:hypothetical protein [Planctomycetota bacterium]HRR78872.1 hypothetical protein [Planctomycetota bacterium]HRT94993.1 hypothetical protein [Planctomycetota bacterium]
MMGAASHFLVGMLCGAALGGVAVALRRRWLVWLPPFVLACGCWAEGPLLLGMPHTAHPLANLFFGYAWLHPWLAADEVTALFFVLGLTNLMLLAYVVFLARYHAAADMVRWEREGPSPPPSKARTRRAGRQAHSGG